MKTLLLALLLPATAKAAPLITGQDFAIKVDLATGNVVNAYSTFTISQNISSNTAPTSNALYSKMVPFAAAVYAVTATSATTYGAINISSITRVATGVTRINFVTSTIGLKYGVICVPSSGARTCASCNSRIDSAQGCKDRTKKSVDIEQLNASGGVSDGDADPITIFIYDYGDTPQ